MRIIQPRTVAEQLLYSTVRISGDNGTGTGFFFHIQLDQDKQIQLILQINMLLMAIRNYLFIFTKQLLMTKNLNQQINLFL